MLLLLSLSGGVSAKYPVGVSLSLFQELSDSTLTQIRGAGIRYVEVTFHSFTRGRSGSEYTRAFELRNRLERAGLRVWSCHLPFGRGCDISVTDPEQRERNVAYIERMIRLAAVFSPERLVLHPASRPVPEEERTAREQYSANSVCRLSLAAREIGAVLCVENMPHSIGRTSEEMLRLIGACPEVMVCFDSNHLLLESHADFFAALGSRIATVHVSDYDGGDERHWLPGKGVIDWPRFYDGLRGTGYKGVFMFEVRSGDASCPEIVDVYGRIVRGEMKQD